MRFYILLFFTGVSIPQLNAQTANNSLVFREIKYDFGNIKEKDGKVTHTFIFSNTGRTPVVIENVITGCSCTAITFSKAPVKTGKQGRITVCYNPAYRKYLFSKEIDVVTNEHNNVNRIWIKGNVIPIVVPE
ncbi:DUF1573 domain-containing protein [Chitinophaga sancti]|uniref:DUF1573 domain-containing protein n=1 Tax=Chitinophaga sancti TaxID=1004 RepID=UPI002A75F3C6|nr:DUF1573 domain-containing protein [Chitinophaga sancti]WPQ66179.1 DUF1573 domain-containing protein [Chitinophaga sancti]